MKRARIVGTTLLFLAVGAVGAVAQAEAQGSRGRGRGRQERVSPDEQRQRVEQEQKRATDYKQHLAAQVRVVQQQTAQLQAQRRTAQYRAQQEYQARLEQQEQRLRATRDYSHDPYVSAPPTYRYAVGDAYRETNQYGADVLRQAVTLGYQEGLRAGEADREDGWRADYQNAAAYRDADYGYDGTYVDRADYNYYFRAGFRRGYDDGYHHQSRYGNSSEPSILGSVLSAILNLQSIR